MDGKSLVAALRDIDFGAAAPSDEQSNAPWLTMAQWLASLGVDDVRRGVENIRLIVQCGISFDLLSILFDQIAKHLPGTSDPGGVLNNLERFIQASRSPHSLAALFERDPESLPTLLQIFSISQYLADQLVRDPESFDLLRLTEGQPVALELLRDEICTEVLAAREEQQVLRSLRAYKHRELMRIAYGDFIGQMSLEVVTEQISFLAVAIVEAAVRASLKQTIEKKGKPFRPDGQPARFAVIALGKLGGNELNYSSDIDLFFVADTEGQTNASRPTNNTEFFDRVAKSVNRYLTESTSLGQPYRVDLRLRPMGAQGPLVISATAALQHYDTAGRTWERQAFVKARAIAGDLELANELLSRLQPWVYRRYLSRADISGIRSLKRKIEKRSTLEGSDGRDIKTGRGGIRDIEFVIQFLQLLNGGDLTTIRTGNTLQAMASLEQVGCLTHQERSILEESYRFLRRVEHCLQIMLDLQTHLLPQSDSEMRKLALRAGYRDTPTQSALAKFQSDLAERTKLNRRILDHLLHDAFANSDDMSEESDLILDPEPTSDSISQVLRKFGFQDTAQAYRLLQELACESVTFLSTRRCRHFLAAIAPKLLLSIAATPDPDMTLVNLSRVSDSLGGKAVLWELFSFNPPSMELYVRLCACSPYLVGILTSSPGMIDELLDSLLLNRLPTYDELDEQLAELCRSAEDIEPILHSFKNSQHLRVGVRDILRKESIVDTHTCLSDIAEVLLKQVVMHEYHKLVRRYGVPINESGPREGQACELVILGLGKLGGREPNYHSDIDVLFLFESDGTTRSLVPGRKGDGTTNRHFYNQLSQRIIQSISRMTPFGRLFEIDARLRPSGQSGALAVSFDDLQQYFQSGGGQLWERQSLCKARPIWGIQDARNEVASRIQTLLTEVPWNQEMAESIFQMRLRLQQTASDQNIKRGIGGTVDVEFIVQMLQLAHASTYPSILIPGTLEAIDQLKSVGVLQERQAIDLAHGYRLLRGIESGLRLMNTTARHDVPQDAKELKMLAFLTGAGSEESIATECENARKRNRELFDELFLLQRTNINAD